MANSPPNSGEPTQNPPKRPRALSEGSESSQPPRPPRLASVKRVRIPDGRASEAEITSTGPRSEAEITSTGPRSDLVRLAKDFRLDSTNLYHRELLEHPDDVPDRDLHVLLSMLTQDSAKDTWRRMKAKPNERKELMQQIKNAIDKAAENGGIASTNTTFVPDFEPPRIPSDSQYDGDFETQFRDEDPPPPLPETQLPPRQQHSEYNTASASYTAQRRAMQAEASTMHSVIAQDEAVAGSSQTSHARPKSNSQRAAASTPRPVNASRKTPARVNRASGKKK